MKGISLFKKESWIVVVAVTVSLLFVVTAVQAASTISTNIDTGGTLTVTGAIGASSTAAFGSVTTSYGNLLVNGFATTTATSGNFATQGTITAVGAVAGSSTLQITGATTLYGGLTASAALATLGQATSTQLTVTGAQWLNGDTSHNGNATTTASNGNIATKGTLTVTGAVAASSTLQVTGATTLYSSLTVTTSNTATSTATIGCIQTYATSTLTPVRLELGAANQATTTFGTAGIGLVAWRYGTCP